MLMGLLRTILAVAVLSSLLCASGEAAAQVYGGGYGYGPVYQSYSYQVPYPRQKYHGYWRDLGYGFTPQRTVYSYGYGYGYAPGIYAPTYPSTYYYYDR
jgi:hypothetical protein